MQPTIRTVLDVAEHGLCTGCGACAYMRPGDVRMADSVRDGRRPVAAGEGRSDPRGVREALDACPGIDQSRPDSPRGSAAIGELADSWGPVLAMWEGWAADPRMRFRGSSGGAVSALAAWCVEKGGMHGVLHVAARRDVPYLNETVLSTTRDEIVERSGSRYAPASPCEGLRLVEDAPGPCAFVGKPCDCHAVSKVRALRPALDARLGLVVGFFCAGTPTTAGTIALLARMGIDDPSRVVSLRYRGDGWPGAATAVVETGGRLETRRLTYEESWGGVLADHKQWRCSLCPDRTAETADVAFGDPWWNGVPRDAPGRSLVLVRTERGRRAVLAAVADGYLVLEPAETWKLRASQKGFPKVRGAIWGRRATLRLLGLPVPRCAGAALFSHWRRELTASEKFRSFAGTVKRMFARGFLTRRTGY